VSLTRLEARVRQVEGRVRVTVRLAGASVAGTRKLSISVARCTVTTKKYKNAYEAPDAPSRPTCKPAGASGLGFPRCLLCRVQRASSVSE
jgi:hypothetical protein